ncbi:MAG: PepSY domain-containing protein [Bradyrhizobium sp.]
MKALILLHRWLGVGFCLLFAMWFASGIVMHFVPFPSLTETERFAGLLPIDASRFRHGPDEALAASHVMDARRVRLIQRADGPVYIVSGSSRPRAVHADDLSNGAVTSEPVALGIAKAHAARRGIDATRADIAGVADYDQWSVPNGYDDARPLYRIAVNDPAGTELYVSSTTGEVVLGTTRYQRVWNYLGSVVHWIYPTALRRNWWAWDRVVWTLSLVAMIGAITGVALGIIKLQLSRTGVGSPFRGWHAWHHILGLFTATFVVTWIFSGWLSMDHGLLFSRGRLSQAEAAAVARTPDLSSLHGNTLSISASVKEVEWFAFGERLYLRERTGFASQSLSPIGSGLGNSPHPQPYLTTAEVDGFVRRMAPDCAAPFVVGPKDSYPVSASVPDAPVYRSICGDVWFQIDGASGAVLERLDASRRAYRWAYTALHTLDFPILLAHPALRSGLIVLLCAMGFLFSVTGAVIGWRRLRFHFPSHGVAARSEAFP